MNRHRLIRLSMIVSLVAVGITLVHFSANGSQPLRTVAGPAAAGAGTSDLGARCASSIDADTGFGNVTVDRDLLIDHVDLLIDVPCILHLTSGAALSIRTSRVRTRNLVVMDDGADPASSSVTIDHTALTGTGASGLLIQLRHPKDSITVRVSYIDYPLSVWLTTTDTDATNSAGNIEVSTSRIVSVPRDGAAASEGIHLVAGGQATFLTDSFQTTSAGDDALAVLLGGKGCRKVRVVGAVPTCTA